MIEGTEGFRLLLYALLAGAVAGDIRSFRIPNIIPLLVLGALALALVLSGAPPESWRDAAISGLFGLGAGYLLYRLKMMGGGDGKLIAATAAWFGARSLLGLAFLISLAGIFVALVALVARTTAGAPGGVKAALKTRVPYGVAIALGAMAAAELLA